MKPILLHLNALVKKGNGLYEVHVSYSRQNVVLKEQNIADKYANQILDHIIELTDTGLLMVSCWYDETLYKQIKGSEEPDYADCIIGVAMNSAGAPRISELLIKGARAYVTVPSFTWDDGGNVVATYTLGGKPHSAVGAPSSLPRVNGQQVTTNLFLAGYWVGEQFKPAMRGRDLALGVATPFKFK
jgi:hypothetical protein